MSWFSYKKVAGGIDYYPYVRRSINTFIPKDDILQDTWLFIDVSNLDISSKLDSSLTVIDDQSSYLVVYEPLLGIDSSIGSPVSSVLHNGILYFKAAEDHVAGSQISKQYVIYYKSPNVRYMKSTTYSGQNYFEQTTDLLGQYNPPFSAVDISSFEVFPTSTYSYNFSFVNSGTSWRNSSSSIPGAKCYMTFSGPVFEIYGSKGPEYGKFKLKVISYGDSATPVSNVELDNIIIDCYSTSSIQNTLLYSSTSISQKECSAELEVLADKNILSSGNMITLNSYQFSYNLYLSVDSEELSDAVTYVRVV